MRENGHGALRTTCAAVEDGKVARGGIALIRAWTAIKGPNGPKGANKDQHHGIVTAVRAMEVPLCAIVSDCNEEPARVLNAVKSGAGNYGYNVTTGESVDLIAIGIPSPTKVARTALQNAVAAVGLFIAAGVAVAETATAAVDGGG